MALRLCTLGRYMPSSGLSELLHMLISQASKRRRFRQLLLVPSIVDNSHAVALPDYKQCSASAKFVPLLFGVLWAEYRISVWSPRCRVCRNLCTGWNKLYRVLFGTESLGLGNKLPMVWCGFEQLWSYNYSKLAWSLRCSLDVHQNTKTLNLFRGSCHRLLKWPFRFAWIDYKPFRAAIRQYRRSHLFELFRSKAAGGRNIICAVGQRPHNSRLFCAIGWCDSNAR